MTEPAIYYQSAYVKLLSKFVGAPTTPSTDGGTGDAGPHPTDGAASSEDGVGDGSTGEGGSSSDGGEREPGDDGCGCSVPGGQGVPPGVVLVLLLLWTRRIRRELPRDSDVE